MASIGAPATVRIAAEELDSLVNLVGELVLARNQLLQTHLTSRDTAANAITQRLDVVTSELQEGLMRMRTQPIGAAWSDLAECVQRCAASVGKRIALRTEGLELELDRTLLEGLHAPLCALTELVIERSVAGVGPRAEARAPQDALLEIAARSEGGRIVVELRDDGAGLDQHDAAGQAALARIRTQVAEFGASLEISRTDARSVSRLSIPLTLAITPALLVSAGGERFAIPQTSLVELVRITRGEGPQIEHFAGQSLFRLREALLPVVDLRSALELPREVGVERETSGLVVLQIGAQRYGLAVDAIHDTEEIVVKPLAPALVALGLYSGSTILGDGGVALILDVPGLARSAGIEVSELGGAASKTSASQSDEPTGERERWLVFELRGGRRMAAPLSRVSRLEEFPLAALERSCDTPVVQYRGAILPLVEAAELLGSASATSTPTGDAASVVVLAAEEHRVGLVAECVVDILDEEPGSPIERPRPGVACSAVLGGAVTDVIDVDWFVASARLQGSAQSGDGAEASTGEQSTVRQLCTFRVGELNLAADVDAVQEILRTPGLTRVPRAAAGADALINLRGQTVLTLDLALKLRGHQPTSSERASETERGGMTVVFSTRRGPLAARVDSVGDVIEIDPTQLAPAPRHGESAVLAAVRELYRLPDALLLVLDTERLLGDAPPPAR